MKKEIPKFSDTLTEITLFRHHVEATGILDDMPGLKNSLELETRRCEDFVRGLMVRLRGFILADKPILEPIRVKEPESWWQHFKMEHFPVSFLRRWPVKYKITEIIRPYTIHVCPHANVAWPKNEHFKFLMDAPEVTGNT